MSHVKREASRRPVRAISSESRSTKNDQTTQRNAAVCRMLCKLYCLPKIHFGLSLFFKAGLTISPGLTTKMFVSTLFVTMFVTPLVSEHNNSTWFNMYLRLFHLFCMSRFAPSTVWAFQVSRLETTWVDPRVRVVSRPKRSHSQLFFWEGNFTEVIFQHGFSEG